VFKLHSWFICSYKSFPFNYRYAIILFILKTYLSSLYIDYWTVHSHLSTDTCCHWSCCRRSWW